MANIQKFMKQQAYNVYYGCGNPDHLDCPHCGSTMNFQGGDERALGTGYWECSGCNFSFTEGDLNSVDF